jgi:WD40 repeat protein
MSVQPVPIEVFYSYADTDEDLRSELDKHLSLSRCKRLIAPWHRRLITAGQNWTRALDQHLNTASVILLLISADFVASDYCYGTEMQRAMERHNAGDARVLPILLRPVDWQSAPFGKLQMLPSNGKPITEWHNRDAAFADIVQGIRATLGYEQRRPTHFMVEDLPANFVQRPQEFESLIRCLLDEKREEPIAIITALRGAGGYGKTTLARALCHDKRVQKAFNDGILWVTFGEQPGNLINKIEDLIHTLSGEKPGYTSQEAATTHFVKLLADRAILLVLDDVWNSAHLKPFLQEGKRCARLITTRDERVVPASVPLAQRIQVDAMQQDEAIQLLICGIQCIEEQDLLKQHHTELKRLAIRLGEWPLLLKLASSVLEERINIYMQGIAHAITAVHRALDKRGVTAFDLSNPVERSQAVAKTIEISFEWLRPEERARYQELTIFPEDVDIPLQTLQQLWERTGNLDELDTEELCIRLRSLSLLLHYNAVTQTVRLHDVMRNYLQHQYAPEELTQLHARFLDAYSMVRWADLPQDEPYLWDHLATHLIAAGRTSDLITTVMDGAYLASKASYRPVSLLEQDLILAVEHNPDNPILCRLQHSITNMAHLLHACETWQEYATTVHSRLIHIPQLQFLCQSLEPRLKRPYLTPWHPLPDLPMDGLKRTLTDHTDEVLACAISPDGTWLLSTSSDRTLRIWDTATGKCRHTLTDHAHWVKACAISPNGKWLLSASSDRTFRIWDAATGLHLHSLTSHNDSVSACAISPDGKWFLSGSLDGTLRIWDTASGKIRHTLTGHSNWIKDCVISPDGTWLLSTSWDNTPRIWDTITGNCHHTFTGSAYWINACAISVGGSWLLFASIDHTFRIWDTTTGECRYTIAGNTNLVSACAISPDGTWFLSGSYDGTLRIWDTATGKCRHILTGDTKAVNACAISPDGFWLLSASHDGTLRVWDAATKMCRATLRVNGSLRGCFFCGDRYHIMAGGDGGVYFLRVVDE